MKCISSIVHVLIVLQTVYNALQIQHVNNVSLLLTNGMPLVLNVIGYVHLPLNIGIQQLFNVLIALILIVLHV